MTQLNSNQFPQVYDALGVSIPDLGCIMLDVEPFSVVKHVPNGAADLFFGDTPALRYAQGAVAEVSAHITLLYGLMEPGPIWREHVDEVLKDWEPAPIKIASVGFFESNNPGYDYSVIVGKVEPTDNLLEGNYRLRLLPHIATFPQYVPHLTLAYINNGPSGVEWTETSQEKWVRSLDEHLTGREFPVSRINYGGE